MFLIYDCSISHFDLSFTSQNNTVKLHLVMIGRLNTHLMAISGPGPLDPCCLIEETHIKRCVIISEKQKLFQCDICSKRFGQKLYLKVHKRTHYTV